ncbi:MAG: divalent-cation tolerance protein CutA [Deltaproteobacteria bacterium]|nr:MAG: divalent-cation tolerance protein CutA [Deltaproteobacteria bacterium]
MRVCLVTIPAGKGAELAQMLLGQRQCACVNVVPGVQSYFLEEGQVKHTAEELLILKADDTDIGTLRTAVIENHPYHTPEFVVLPVDEEGTDNDYLRWIKYATRM